MIISRVYPVCSMIFLQKIFGTGVWETVHPRTPLFRNFEVEVAAPGLKKDDFKVELDGNMLTISSEKKNEWEEKEDERYTRREFSYQSFQRSFQLPRDVVDENKIQAKYDNGVLHLVIPKKEHAKQRPPRMIKIN